MRKPQQIEIIKFFFSRLYWLQIWFFFKSDTWELAVVLILHTFSLLFQLTRSYYYFLS